MRDQFKQLLGLATKAGKTVSGEFAVEQAVKNGEAVLVLIAQDASDNTKKHFHDMCTWREIPALEICSKEELGRFTGKIERASVALLDQGFADKLISIKREGSV